MAVAPGGSGEAGGGWKGYGKRSRMLCETISMEDAIGMPEHLPVMVGEVLAFLAPGAGGCYLDTTFGGGGHTRAILEAEPQARVVAADWDPEAGERAKAFIREWGERFEFIDAGLAELSYLGDRRFQGAVLDLGLSAYQIETANRGFSFKRLGPLDMRMDPRRGEAASTFLENGSREDLVRAVRDFGEEPSWRRVVEAILEARGTGSLSDTVQFAELVASAAPLRSPGRGRARIHPATRTFQGVRMAVNDELENLEAGLTEAFARLVPGGVLTAISFHSLEDRIVKRRFRRWAGMPETRFDGRPQQERSKCGELLTRRPLKSSPREVARNPRSRSACLRAIRKLGEAA